MDQAAKSGGFKQEMSSSSGMTAAKRKSAVEAEVIVQNPFIDDLAEFCASDTASSRTC